jgi:imidazolonepropionase-like amidohydrolase
MVLRLPRVQALVQCGALLAPLALLARAPSAPPAPVAPLALFLLGHQIGTERAEIARERDRSVLTTHFEYLDRGTKVALDTTLAFEKDFTPLSFESHGKSYRYFAVDASVPTVAKATVGKPADVRFTLEGVAPISAQGLLVQYWLAHGRPPAIAILPSGDAATVREWPAGADATHGHHPSLREFTIDGIAWGRQRLWLAKDDLHVAAAVTTVGVLGFEALEPSLEPEAQAFIKENVRERLAEAALEAGAIRPRQQATFALVGARLIDGTGAPPIDNATIVVRNGRFDAAGSAESVRIPAGVARVDARGKSVLPGLWDMHAHVGLAEWGPVYLASGVTTARDMGGEFETVTALRDAWLDGKAIGPRLLLAGLIDGPGPASFGHVTAANAVEGRDTVARYAAAHFQQIKLYSLLDRPTVEGIIKAAHAASMTVTGHIPNGLTMREVVEMGMDHVAHLTVRDAPGSDALKDTTAFLKAHGTVIDPTISWNELLGRSRDTPIESFQPGIEHAAPALRRLIDGANGGNVTPEQARDRLARSLQIIKALHEAGVPIVAGTDKGVPGVSVAREIELYVQAGISPIDAIRAATAVPARVMGLAHDSGTIAPGLRADFIVVDGNPLERIADIRKVTMVSASGRLYDTAPLWKLGGFKP